eukprot:scaffold96873_cov19-Tisochrysis_lutea.AAC.4
MKQALTDASKEGPATTLSDPARASEAHKTTQREEESNGVASKHTVLSPRVSGSASNSQQQQQQQQKQQGHTAPSASHDAQADKGAARAAAYLAFTSQA